eukprot:COSAG02_NODE_22241_length_758_cov_3.289833_1_plen_189_part_01
MFHVATPTGNRPLRVKYSAALASQPAVLPLFSHLHWGHWPYSLDADPLGPRKLSEHCGTPSTPAPICLTVQKMYMHVYMRSFVHPDPGITLSWPRSSDPVASSPRRGGAVGASSSRRRGARACAFDASHASSPSRVVVGARAGLTYAGFAASVRRRTRCRCRSASSVRGGPRRLPARYVRSRMALRVRD